MIDALAVLKELVSVPGAPGHEGAICEAVDAHVRALGYDSVRDMKGNLLVPLPPLKDPLSLQKRIHVVVTAHLDEIALMVSKVNEDGTLTVVPLGGVHTWKWGEQPVEIQSREPVLGVISYGCVHTTSPQAIAQKARTGALLWEHAKVFTGLSKEELMAKGVHPGIRVVLARERRTVNAFGDILGAYFMDDRAPIVSMLLALEALKGVKFPEGVVFAATTSEEVGGEGAMYIMHQLQPDYCIALEIGPITPECPLELNAQPTVWVNDGYSAMNAEDMQEVGEVCASIGLTPQWQALGRGGSDASCAATKGLTARPLTFAMPTENSHGYELIHKDAMTNLAHLLAAYLKRVKSRESRV